MEKLGAMRVAMIPLVLLLAACGGGGSTDNTPFNSRAGFGGNGEVNAIAQANDRCAKLA